MARFWISGSIVNNDLNKLRHMDLTGVAGIELAMYRDLAEVSEAVAWAQGAGIAYGFHHPLIKDPAFARDLGVQWFALSKELSSHDRVLRAAALSWVEDSLERAYNLGGQHLVVHAPTKIRDLDSPPITEDDCRALMTRTLSHLAHLAEKTGVQILIESDGPNPYYMTPGSLVELVAPYPHLAHCLDTMHFAVFTGKYGYPCTVEELTVATAPYTASIHLSNTISPSGSGIDLRPPGSQHLRLPVHPDQDPADGWIDIQAVVSEVTYQNPDCLLIMEHIPYRDCDLQALAAWGRDPHGYASEAIDWVRQLAKGNGNDMAGNGL